MATTAGKEKKETKILWMEQLEHHFSRQKSGETHKSSQLSHDAFSPSRSSHTAVTRYPTIRPNSRRAGLVELLFGKRVGNFLGVHFFFGGGKTQRNEIFLRPKIRAPFFGRLNVQLEGEILSGRWFVGLVTRHLGLCWLHVLELPSSRLT